MFLRMWSEIVYPVGSFSLGDSPSELAFSLQGPGTRLSSWLISWAGKSLICVKGLTCQQFFKWRKSALADGTKRFASGNGKTARSTFSVDKLTAWEKSFSNSSWIYISVHICFSALEGNEVCVCVCVYFEFQFAFLYSLVLLVFITSPVLLEVLIMGVLSGAPCLGDHRHPCLLGLLVLLLPSGLVSLQTCAQLLPWNLSLLFWILSTASCLPSLPLLLDYSFIYCNASSSCFLKKDSQEINWMSPVELAQWVGWIQKS